MILALSILSGPASSAAGDAEPAFRRVKQARYGTYFSHSGSRRDVDVRRAEAFLERLFAVFGRPPEGWRIEYYRHASYWSLRDRVGFMAVGVTDLRTGRIDSVLAYHPHELVHAVACAIGRTPPLFEEGLAEALTTAVSRQGRSADAVALEFVRRGGRLDSLVAGLDRADPEREYAVANSFVAFLLGRHGVERFVAFASSCGRGVNWERALQSSFGRGFADLERDWKGGLLAGAQVERTWLDPGSWPLSLRRTRSAAEVAVATDTVIRPGSSPTQVADTAVATDAEAALPRDWSLAATPPVTRLAGSP